MKARILLPFLLVLSSASLFAAGGACPTGNTIDPNGNPISLSSLGITSCFYISKSTGSDSNAGTTEATAWAHLPGMPSCTSLCSSTSIAAGTGFILRGGDTWTSSDLGVTWGHSGTSTNPIYIGGGIDLTWYNATQCGSSWCRPIWNAGGATNGNMFQWNSSSYLILDNIEWTGMRNNQNGCTSGGGSGTNVRCTELYIHGWSHTGSTDNVGFFAQGNSGSMADHNIIDGSDSSQNTFNVVYSGWSQFQYNYVQYVVSGVLAGTDVVHDNVILHSVTSIDGDHCNGIFTFSPYSGSTQLIYNNVVSMGTGCPGGVNMWFNGNAGGNSSWVGFGFGNLMYEMSGGNQVNIGNHATANYGTYYWFNNTVDCTAGGCGGTPGNSYWTIYDQNNHTIGGPLGFTCSSGCTVPVCSNGAGAGCTDLNQTEAQANAQGYSSSEIYPYSPISTCTSSTCGTVQNGTNVQSYCSILSGTSGVGTSAAATACQYSTSVGCAYNTTNHTLTCPNDTLVARPSSGAWNIGAYQSGPAGCSITPTSVGPYTAGQSVSQQFTASNCPSSSFTVSSGSLSGSGLALSSEGLLSGTAEAGSFTFTVAYATASVPISLTNDGAPSITTSSLAAGQVNVSYSQVLATSGGTGTITCAVTAGSLPSGLSLSGCTISGIPTIANTYSFSVTPTDSHGISGSARALSILVNAGTAPTPTVLHTTFCGPASSWPGTCTLSAATTAGSRLVVVYSSYNSAGTTSVMNSITDGGDAFAALPNTQSTDTASGNSSWNQIWSAGNVTAGVTSLTITTSTSQTGDVYVWELQNAENVMSCGSLSSQPAANPAVGASLTTGPNVLLLAHFHPAPGGDPTGVSAPFTIDTISDQMAYAYYLTSTSTTSTPQWTQTAEPFATATCAFSTTGSAPTPPTFLPFVTK